MVRAKLVGIECGANGESENLAGMHVLHDNSAVVRLGLLHGMIERALGHELNVLVDGEDHVPARLGFVLARAQDLRRRVHGGVHLARNAVELRVEFLLQAAQAVVVHAHIAQHLRGDLVVRVEALEFFLEVDPLHVEATCAHAAATCGVTRRATQAKLCPCVEALGNLIFRGLGVVGVGVNQGGSAWAAACLSSISVGSA